MPKQMAYWMLVCCLVLGLVGCTGAPESTEVSAPVVEDGAEEETIPTETAIPPQNPATRRRPKRRKPAQKMKENHQWK